jgi:arginase family enzyme
VLRFEQALKALAGRCDFVAVSFDLDAVAECHAPGVSAPQADGFSASEAIEMMTIAGTHPKVASLGIFELNPEHDIGDRTARLAATSVFYFAAAVLGRA